jgi:arylsulfatase A-like enzyme
MEASPVPGTDARLTGAVDADFQEREPGTIRVVVDALGPRETTEIWSANLSPGSPRAEVSADLSSWANQVVGLRLRVFGDTNGVVSWESLGATASTTRDGSAPPPYEIVAPPVSGALNRPDVFLIILDAARADRFDGPLGAELAPHVQALAAEGTAFTHAWAPSSWTGQSIPAVWSGLTPDSVGIEHWGSRLSPELTTFPELLFEAGYRTTLWTQHNIYRARQSLRHGFEVFEEVDSTSLEDRELLPAVSEMVDGDKPAFAAIHLLPPHAPYIPPAPFLGSRSGWYDGGIITARMLHLFDSLYPEDQVDVRDETRRAAIAQYEENVRFADHLVGRLVDDLKRQGRYDDALIIVTSDHGEAFYEHGLFLHTSYLYEEFIRVPLVVKWPRGFEGFSPVVDTPVSLIDIAPTIVDGLGIDDERARYQGRSLLPLALGGQAPNRVLYAYTSGQTDPELPPSPQAAVLWNDLKLIRDEGHDRIAMFRLSDDPGERVDLSQGNFHAAWLDQTLRQIRAHNAGFLLELGGASVEDLDADTVRRLKALGYLR